MNWLNKRLFIQSLALIVLVFLGEYTVHQYFAAAPVVRFTMPAKKPADTGVVPVGHHGQNASVRIKHSLLESQVILDLDSPTGTFKVLNQTLKQTTIQVHTALASHSLRGEQFFYSGPIENIRWNENKGVLTVKIMHQPVKSRKLYALAHPDRLVLSLSPAPAASQSTKKPLSFSSDEAQAIVSQPASVQKPQEKSGIQSALPEPDVLKPQLIAPGVLHLRVRKACSRGPLLINVLEVDPKTPGIEIFPALASPLLTVNKRLTDIAQSHHAIAAINATYFKQDLGIPLGALIIDGELLAGPIYNRVALGIDANNNLKMQRIRILGDVMLPGQPPIRINNINQPRLSPTETVVYTPRWGARAPRVPENGLQIQLIHGKVTQVSTQESLAIPQEGYVLSGPKTEAWEALASADAQTPVSLRLYTLPDWSDMTHAVGGGPYLVKDGSIFVDSQAQHVRFLEHGSVAPRTALGITQSGKLLMVTVDGRQAGSVGVTLGEMAGIMRQLGARHAMNLDGGSSTQMVVNGTLTNSPAVPGGARISNGLMVRYTPPKAVSR